MVSVNMRELLDAGVHFGHQTQRWNPKMKPYIMTARNGIYIVDLRLTAQAFREALDFLRDLAANDGNVLFVGTKRQAQDAVREAAENTGMFFVNQRWLGGLLTNFETIRKSVARLFSRLDLSPGEFPLPGMVLIAAPPAFAQEPSQTQHTACPISRNAAPQRPC